MRILAGKAAEARVRELEQRGATDLRRVEKLVAPHCDLRQEKRRLRVAQIRGEMGRPEAQSTDESLKLRDGKSMEDRSRRFQAGFRCCVCKHQALLRMAKATAVDQGNE